MHSSEREMDIIGPGGFMKKTLLPEGHGTIAVDRRHRLPPVA
jgi:hypothetical protein